MSGSFAVHGEVWVHEHSAHGWLHTVVVTPLPPEGVRTTLGGSHPSHALVTLFGPWGPQGRSYALETDAYIAPSYFAEKMGPFASEVMRQDALDAVVGALSVLNPPADVKAEERSA